MFTQKEGACIAWVLSLNSRLLKSKKPFSFKRGSLLKDIYEAPWTRALQPLCLVIVAFEFLASLSTLSTTIGTKVVIHIFVHALHLLLTSAALIEETTLHFYGQEIQELINQTLKANSDFCARFLGMGRKDLCSGSTTGHRRREAFLYFLIFMVFVCAGVLEMGGLFLIFWDLPFTVYPGPKVLMGNHGVLLLMAIVKLGLFLKVTPTCSLLIVGMFCINSTLFWVKKTRYEYLN
jgi:hypothetical protein